MQRDRLPYLLIPLAACIAIFPLILHGCSCGHDFDFHLLNWMEAAHQFTHGNLHPHWAFTPAYDAGEPRFVFYPPLSWTLGAILTLALPITATPIVYTWLALTASGFALHKLARDFTPPTAALIAAILYTVNPYMLFTAYERTAYAELLAAAWIPLLLHAILRERVTIPGIAIPIALLWLTNAPAAVMSCYALALLTIIRLVHPIHRQYAPLIGSSGFTKTPPPQWKSPKFPASVISTEANHGLIVNREVEKPASLPPNQTRLEFAFNTIAGTILGLALAAFYIIPAAYERRFVQIAMAIIPNMRIQDNFLFHHTGDAPHDQVLHTASLIAVTLVAVTAITLLALHQAKKSRVPHPSRPHRDGWDLPSSSSQLLMPLVILTIAITLLLTPLTALIWNHAPELAFLQFPWRFLAILAAVLGLSIALALNPIHLKPSTRTLIAVTLAAAFTYPAYTLFHQTCDEEDTPAARHALFRSNQGDDPTDEYTPTTADNDSLAHNDPAFWLSSNPNSQAPKTNTNPAPAPTHLTIDTPTAEDLILNLRDYPAWHITLNGTTVTTRDQRDDGLIAFPVPGGHSLIAIDYAHTLDQTLGDTISLLALAALFFILRKPSTVP